jgi:PhnB protein
MTTPAPGNLVPYLFYSDIESMIDWYSRVFGFVEGERWRGPDGRVHNAEMRTGDTELWMDGAHHGRHHLTDPDGKPLSIWVGIWLAAPSDVDAMYEHVVAEGATPEQAPVDLPYGVRSFNVRDPEGYLWGFMCRIQAAGDR